MDVKLTREQELILARGIANGAKVVVKGEIKRAAGYITTLSAVNICRTENRAKSELKFLQEIGYLQMRDTGLVFDVATSPPERVWLMANSILEADKTRQASRDILAEAEKIDDVYLAGDTPPGQ